MSFRDPEQGLDYLNNYYAILNHLAGDTEVLLNPESTIEDIKTIRNKAAKNWSADTLQTQDKTKSLIKGVLVQSDKNMTLINEAWSILSDENKRREYNGLLENWQNQGTISDTGVPIVGHAPLDDEGLEQFRILLSISSIEDELAVIESLGNNPGLQIKKGVELHEKLNALLSSALSAYDSGNILGLQSGVLKRLSQTPSQEILAGIDTIKANLDTSHTLQLGVRQRILLLTSDTGNNTDFIDNLPSKSDIVGSLEGMIEKLSPEIAAFDTVHEYVLKGGVANMLAHQNNSTHKTKFAFQVGAGEKALTIIIHIETGEELDIVVGEVDFEKLSNDDCNIFTGFSISPYLDNSLQINYIANHIFELLKNDSNYSEE